MDRSLLAARIQEILKGRPKPAPPAALPQGEVDGPSPAARTDGATLPRRLDGPGGYRATPPPRLDDEESAFAARCAADAASADAAEVLGGEVIEGPAGRAFVVERCYPESFEHGRRRVGEYSEKLGAAVSCLPQFLEGPEGEGDGSRCAWPLFFDLETTGLSGGAGTYAFLVGCGYFEGSHFRTHQFFLRGYGEERALLEVVRAFIEEHRAAAVTASEHAGGSAPSPPFDEAQGAVSASRTAGRPDTGLPVMIDPPPILRAVKSDVGSPSALRLPPTLITYNGKSFDLPLIETRYLFHRRTSPFASLPHVDMLFAARRLWKRRNAWREASGEREVRGQVWRETSASREAWREASASRAGASCALTALEEDILGLRRHDDVPGWEIPARYFGYTRTGDAGGLVAVLEHNRLDLLSLAAVTALILEMVTEQERVVRGCQEFVALARLLEYLGREADAERCYERAAEPEGFVEGELDRLVRAEALRWLAVHRRRTRRFPEAAEAWRRLLEIPGLDAVLRREACEALAVHHEHRAKDFALAQSFARRALDVARGGRFEPDVEHRLDRLSRKLHARRPADDGPTQVAFPVQE